MVDLGAGGDGNAIKYHGQYRDPGAATNIIPIKVTAKLRKAGRKLLAPTHDP